MRQEWKPTPLGSIKMIKRDSISIGEMILANVAGFEKTLLGVVVKFRQKPEKGSKKKFYFSTLKFMENLDVEYLLHPCYCLVEDGSLVLNEGWSTFLDKNSYEITVNSDCVDFQNFKVTDDFFEYLVNE